MARCVAIEPQSGGLGVPSSNLGAPTNKIKHLSRFHDSLLPREPGWEAPGKQTRPLPHNRECGYDSRHAHAGLAPPSHSLDKLKVAFLDTLAAEVHQSYADTVKARTCIASPAFKPLSPIFCLLRSPLRRRWRSVALSRQLFRRRVKIFRERCSEHVNPETRCPNGPEGACRNAR
jgi:hypothetical protein